MVARGEPLRNLPAESGEIYMQRQVSSAIASMETPIIFDVGANIGLWTLQFLELQQNEKCKIFCFEPVPKTREKLLAALPTSDECRSIEVVPVALSDEDGSSHINILGSETSGRNSVVDDPLQIETPLDRIEIETRTVDSFVAEKNIDRVNFLKNDTEGHDYFVLCGAAELLNSGQVDVVQFEYTKRWIDSRSFLKDVFNLIRNKPYRLARIREDRLEVFDQWHAEMERFFAANYALVHDSALSWFDVRRGSFDEANAFVCD